MSDYTALRSVLDLAYEQAASGKGRERHANGEPFNQQPICEISRRLGQGYTLGQAVKKCLEADGMIRRGQHDAAEREMLGAIVYLAAQVIVGWERRPTPSIHDREAATRDEYLPHSEGDA